MRDKPVGKPVQKVTNKNNRRGQVTRTAGATVIRTPKNAKTRVIAGPGPLPSGAAAPSGTTTRRTAARTAQATPNSKVIAQQKATKARYAAVDRANAQAAAYGKKTPKYARSMAPTPRKQPPR